MSREREEYSSVTASRSTSRVGTTAAHRVPATASVLHGAHRPPPPSPSTSKTPPFPPGTSSTTTTTVSARSAAAAATTNNNTTSGNNNVQAVQLRNAPSELLKRVLVRRRSTAPRSASRRHAASAAPSQSDTSTVSNLWPRQQQQQQQQPPPSQQHQRRRDEPARPSSSPLPPHPQSRPLTGTSAEHTASAGAAARAPPMPSWNTVHYSGGGPRGGPESTRTRNNGNTLCDASAAGVNQRAQHPQQPPAPAVRGKTLLHPSRFAQHDPREGSDSAEDGSGSSAADEADGDALTAADPCMMGLPPLLQYLNFGKTFEFYSSVLPRIMNLPDAETTPAEHSGTDVLDAAASTAQSYTRDSILSFKLDRGSTQGSSGANANNRTSKGSDTGARKQRLPPFPRPSPSPPRSKASPREESSHVSPNAEDDAHEGPTRLHEIQMALSPYMRHLSRLEGAFQGAAPADVGSADVSAAAAAHRPEKGQPSAANVECVSSSAGAAPGAPQHSEDCTSTTTTTTTCAAAWLAANIRRMEEKHFSHCSNTASVGSPPLSSSPSAAAAAAFGVVAPDSDAAATSRNEYRVHVLSAYSYPPPRRALESYLMLPSQQQKGLNAMARAYPEAAAALLAPLAHANGTGTPQQCSTPASGPCPAPGGASITSVTQFTGGRAVSPLSMQHTSYTSAASLQQGQRHLSSGGANRSTSFVATFATERGAGQRASPTPTISAAEVSDGAEREPFSSLGENRAVAPTARHALLSPPSPSSSCPISRAELTNILVLFGVRAATEGAAGRPARSAVTTLLHPSSCRAPPALSIYSPASPLPSELTTVAPVSREVFVDAHLPRPSMAGVGDDRSSYATPTSLSAGSPRHPNLQARSFSEVLRHMAAPDTGASNTETVAAWRQMHGPRFSAIHPEDTAHSAVVPGAADDVSLLLASASPEGRLLSDVASGTGASAAIGGAGDTTASFGADAFGALLSPGGGTGGAYAVLTTVKSLAGSLLDRGEPEAALHTVLAALHWPVAPPRLRFISSFNLLRRCLPTSSVGTATLAMEVWDALLLLPIPHDELLVALEQLVKPNIKALHNFYLVYTNAGVRGPSRAYRRILHAEATTALVVLGHLFTSTRNGAITKLLEGLLQDVLCAAWMCLLASSQVLAHCSTAAMTGCRHFNAHDDAVGGPTSPDWANQSEAQRLCHLNAATLEKIFTFALSSAYHSVWAPLLQNFQSHVIETLVECVNSSNADTLNEEETTGGATNPMHGARAGGPEVGRECGDAERDSLSVAKDFNYGNNNENFNFNNNGSRPSSIATPGDNAEPSPSPPPLQSSPPTQAAGALQVRQQAAPQHPLSPNSPPSSHRMSLSASPSAFPPSCVFPTAAAATTSAPTTVSPQPPAPHLSATRPPSLWKSIKRSVSNFIGLDFTTPAPGPNDRVYTLVPPPASPPSSAPPSGVQPVRSADPAPAAAPADAPREPSIELSTTTSFPRLPPLAALSDDDRHARHGGANGQDPNASDDSDQLGDLAADFMYSPPLALRSRLPESAPHSPLFSVSSTFPTSFPPQDYLSSDHDDAGAKREWLLVTLRQVTQPYCRRVSVISSASLALNAFLVAWISAGKNAWPVRPAEAAGGTRGYADGEDPNTASTGSFSEATGREAGIRATGGVSLKYHDEFSSETRALFVAASPHQSPPPPGAEDVSAFDTADGGSPLTREFCPHLSYYISEVSTEAILQLCSRLKGGPAETTTTDQTAPDHRADGGSSCCCGACVARWWPDVLALCPVVLRVYGGALAPSTVADFFYYASYPLTQWARTPPRRESATEQCSAPACGAAAAGGGRQHVCHHHATVRRRSLLTLCLCTAAVAHHCPSLFEFVASRSLFPLLATASTLSQPTSLQTTMKQKDKWCCNDDVSDDDGDGSSASDVSSVSGSQTDLNGAQRFQAGDAGGGGDNGRHSAPHNPRRRRGTAFLDEGDAEDGAFHDEELQSDNQLLLPCLCLLAHNVPNQQALRTLASGVQRLVQMGLRSRFSLLQATSAVGVSAVYTNLQERCRSFLYREAGAVLQLRDSLEVPVQQLVPSSGASHRAATTITPTSAAAAAVALSRSTSHLFQTGHATPGLPRPGTVRCSSTLGRRPVRDGNGFHDTTTRDQWLLNLKRRCLDALLLVQPRWPSTTLFFADVCVEYLTHRDAALRMLAVRCAVPLLLGGCLDLSSLEAKVPTLLKWAAAAVSASGGDGAGAAEQAGGARSTRIGCVTVTCTASNPQEEEEDEEEERARGGNDGDRDGELLPRRAAVTVAPPSTGGVSATGSERTEEDADGSSLVPPGQRAWRLDSSCVRHTGQTHISVMRTVLHALVEVSVSDPEHLIREAALQSFTPETFQYLYPHPHVLNSLFAIIYDSHPPNQIAAARLLRQLATFNPPLIYPRLRKVLSRVVKDHVARPTYLSLHALATMNVVDTRPSAANDDDNDKNSGDDDLSAGDAELSDMDPSLAASQAGDGVVVTAANVINSNKNNNDDNGYADCVNNFIVLRPFVPAHIFRLLAELTRGLLHSTPFYLPQLLALIHSALRRLPATPSEREATLAALQLMGMLAEDCGRHDRQLFHPFVALLRNQLLQRDGDFARLRLSVVTLQTILQFGDVTSFSPPVLQSVVSQLLSLLHQRPSISVELSFAVLKLLGTVSLLEPQQGDELMGHSVPALLRKPQSVLQLPTLRDLLAARYSTSTLITTFRIPLPASTAAAATTTPNGNSQAFGGGAGASLGHAPTGAGRGIDTSAAADESPGSTAAVSRRTTTYWCQDSASPGCGVVGDAAQPGAALSAGTAPRSSPLPAAASSAAWRISTGTTDAAVGGGGSDVTAECPDASAGAVLEVPPSLTEATLAVAEWRRQPDRFAPFARDIWPVTVIQTLLVSLLDGLRSLEPTSADAVLETLNSITLILRSSENVGDVTLYLPVVLQTVREVLQSTQRSTSTADSNKSTVPGGVLVDASRRTEHDHHTRQHHHHHHHHHHSSSPQGAQTTEKERTWHHPQEKSEGDEAAARQHLGLPLQSGLSSSLRGRLAPLLLTNLTRLVSAVDARVAPVFADIHDFLTLCWLEFRETTVYEGCALLEALGKAAPALLRPHHLAWLLRLTTAFASFRAVLMGLSESDAAEAARARGGTVAPGGADGANDDASSPTAVSNSDVADDVAAAVAGGGGGDGRAFVLPEVSAVFTYTETSSQTTLDESQTSLVAGTSFSAGFGAATTARARERASGSALAIHASRREREVRRRAATNACREILAAIHRLLPFCSAGSKKEVSLQLAALVIDVPAAAATVAAAAPDSDKKSTAGSHAAPASAPFGSSPFSSPPPPLEEWGITAPAALPRLSPLFTSLDGNISDGGAAAGEGVPHSRTRPSSTRAATTVSAAPGRPQLLRGDDRSLVGTGVAGMDGGGGGAVPDMMTTDHEVHAMTVNRLLTQVLMDFMDSGVLREIGSAVVRQCLARLKVYASVHALALSRCSRHSFDRRSDEGSEATGRTDDTAAAEDARARSERDLLLHRAQHRKDELSWCCGSPLMRVVLESSDERTTVLRNFPLWELNSSWESLTEMDLLGCMLYAAACAGTSGGGGRSSNIVVGGMANMDCCQRDILAYMERRFGHSSPAVQFYRAACSPLYVMHSVSLATFTPEAMEEALRQPTRVYSVETPTTDSGDANEEDQQDADATTPEDGGASPVSPGRTGRRGPPPQHQHQPPQQQQSNGGVSARAHSSNSSETIATMAPHQAAAQQAEGRGMPTVNSRYISLLPSQVSLDCMAQTTATSFNSQDIFGHPPQLHSDFTTPIAVAGAGTSQRTLSQRALTDSRGSHTGRVPFPPTEQQHEYGEHHSSLPSHHGGQLQQQQQQQQQQKRLKSPRHSGSTASIPVPIRPFSSESMNHDGVASAAGSSRRLVSSTGTLTCPPTAQQSPAEAVATSTAGVMVGGSGGGGGSSSRHASSPTSPFSNHNNNGSRPSLSSPHSGTATELLVFASSPPAGLGLSLGAIAAATSSAAARAEAEEAESGTPGFSQPFPEELQQPHVDTASAGAAAAEASRHPSHVSSPHNAPDKPLQGLAAEASPLMLPAGNPSADGGSGADRSQGTPGAPASLLLLSPLSTGSQARPAAGFVYQREDSHQTSSEEEHLLLLNLFLSSRRCRTDGEWHTWFTAFGVRLLERSRLVCVQRCVRLVQLYKPSLLYSPIFSVAFLAYLEGLPSMHVLRQWIEALCSFYDPVTGALSKGQTSSRHGARYMSPPPPSVGGEITNLVHSLRLTSASLFDHETHAYVRDALTPLLVARFAHYSLNPALALYHGEQSVMRDLTPETLRLVVKLRADVGTAYGTGVILYDPRLQRVMETLLHIMTSEGTPEKSADPLVKPLEGEASPSCDSTSPPFLSAESLPRLPHLVQVPRFDVAAGFSSPFLAGPFSEAGAAHSRGPLSSTEDLSVESHLLHGVDFMRLNPSFLEVLGLPHLAANRYLAHHPALHAFCHSHNMKVPVSAGGADAGSRGDGSPPLDGDDVAGAMRCFLVCFDFESVLQLWARVKRSKFVARTAAAARSESDGSAAERDSMSDKPAGPIASSTSANSRATVDQGCSSAAAKDADNSHDESSGGRVLQSLLWTDRALRGSSNTNDREVAATTLPPRVVDHPPTSVKRYAGLAAEALSRWDVVREVTADDSVSLFSEDAPLTRWPAAPSRASAASWSLTVHNIEEEVVQRRQLQIFLGASQTATRRYAEAKSTLAHVRNELKRYSDVFQTENTRAKLDLACLLLQLSDLEEGIRAIEFTDADGGSENSGYPSRGVRGRLYKDATVRRLRSIVSQPLPPTYTALQRLQIVSVRSALVPLSWQLANVLLLCEQVEWEGQPMRSAALLRHFEVTAKTAARDTDDAGDTSTTEFCQQLRLERYRRLVRDLSSVPHLTQLYSSITACLRRDLAATRAVLGIAAPGDYVGGPRGATMVGADAEREEAGDGSAAEDAQSGDRTLEASLLPRARHRQMLSVAELHGLPRLSHFQTQLLLVNVACRRRIRHVLCSDDMDDQRDTGTLLTAAVHGELVSSTQCTSAVLSPIGEDAERFPLHADLSMVPSTAAASSSGGLLSGRTASGDAAASAVSNAESDRDPHHDALTDEAALLTEYYLMEHAITTTASEPSVWREFALLLFDICTTMHAEWLDTRDPETHDNFLRQSAKAISALQRAALLWQEGALRAEGIGPFPTASGRRQRHVRSALPAAHLMLKALHLATLCDKSAPEAAAVAAAAAAATAAVTTSASAGPDDTVNPRPTTAGSGDRNDTAEKESSLAQEARGGVACLDFSASMLVLWVAVTPFLISAATQHASVLERLKEVCCRSSRFFQQMAFQLVANFDHPHDTPFPQKAPPLETAAGGGAGGNAADFGQSVVADPRHHELGDGTNISTLRSRRMRYVLSSTDVVNFNASTAISNSSFSGAPPGFAATGSNRTSPRRQPFAGPQTASGTAAAAEVTSRSLPAPLLCTVLLEIGCASERHGRSLEAVRRFCSFVCPPSVLSVAALSTLPPIPCGGNGAAPPTSLQSEASSTEVLPLREATWAEGECCLPAPLWFVPQDVATEDTSSGPDATTSGDLRHRRQQSRGLDSTRATDRESNTAGTTTATIATVAAANRTDYSKSGGNSGAARVLSALRVSDSSPTGLKSIVSARCKELPRGVSLDAKQQREQVVSLLLSDGFTVHFQHVWDTAATSISDKNGKAAAVRSASHVSSSGIQLSAEMNLPGDTTAPLVDLEASFPPSSSLHHILPTALMESTASLLFSLLPMFHLRRPFVLPVGLQHFLSQFPNRAIRHDAYYHHSARDHSSSSAPLSSIPDTRQAQAPASSRLPPSLHNLHAEYAVHLRKQDIVEATRVARAPTLPPQLLVSCQGVSVTAAQDGNKEELSSPPPPPPHSEAAYQKLLAAAFDSGEVEQLVNYLEQRVERLPRFLLGSTPSATPAQEHQRQQLYEFLVSLPRPLEEVTELLQELRPHCAPQLQQGEEAADQARARLQSVREVLWRRESERHRRALREAIASESTSGPQWLLRHSTYTKELAEMCLVQFLYDIQDRGSRTFLVDTDSGHVSTQLVGRSMLQPPVLFSSARESGARATPPEAHRFPLLRSPFPCTDPVICRLTPSLLHALPVGSPYNTFQSYAARSLHEIYGFVRDLKGIGEFGVETVRCFATVRTDRNTAASVAGANTTTTQFSRADATNSTAPATTARAAAAAATMAALSLSPSLLQLPSATLSSGDAAGATANTTVAGDDTPSFAPSSPPMTQRPPPLFTASASASRAGDALGTAQRSTVDNSTATASAVVERQAPRCFDATSLRAKLLHDAPHVRLVRAERSIVPAILRDLRRERHEDRAAAAAAACDGDPAHGADAQESASNRRASTNNNGSRDRISNGDDDDVDSDGSDNGDAEGPLGDGNTRPSRSNSCPSVSRDGRSDPYESAFELVAAMIRAATMPANVVGGGGAPDAVSHPWGSWAPHF